MVRRETTGAVAGTLGTTMGIGVHNLFATAHIVVEAQALSFVIEEQIASAELFWKIWVPLLLAAALLTISFLPTAFACGHSLRPGPPTSFCFLDMEEDAGEGTTAASRSNRQTDQRALNSRVVHG